MERRRHKRIYIHLKARMIVDDETYDGYIENISETGIGYLISSPARFKDDYLTNKNIELTFQIESGKTIVLACVATWSKKGLGSSKTIGFGMNIVDPPPEYEEWLRSLPL